MKKIMPVIFALIFCLISCSTDNVKSNSETEGSFDWNSLPELNYNVEEFFTDVGFISAPHMEKEPFPDKEPVAYMIIVNDVKAGDTEFKCQIIEEQGKQMCVHECLYILERKNENGEWVLLGVTDDFYKQNYGNFNETVHLRTVEEGAVMKSTKTISAKYHGLDYFPAGEYRISRKASFFTDNGIVYKTFTTEFTVK